MSKRGKSSQTICWECRNAVNGCSWSRTFTPVKGWVAEREDREYDPVWRPGQITTTYTVRCCPLFAKG